MGKLLCAVLLAAMLATCDGGWALAQAPEPAGHSIAAGQTAFDKGDYAAALALWQRALVTLEKSNDKRTSDVLSRVASAYYALGDSEKALESVRRALAFDIGNNDRAGQAADFENLGVLQAKLGRYAEALASWQQALTIDRALNNRSREAADLGLISRVEVIIGRYDEALEAQQQSLVIDRALKDRRGEGDDLGSLGIIAQDLGRYDQALALQQQALAIARALRDKEAEAAALGNIGNVELYLGRFNEALIAQQQVLAIYRALKDTPAQGTALANVGLAEDALGRHEAALASLQQALAIDRALKLRRSEALDLVNIAHVYQNLGRYDDQRSTARDAIDLATQMSDRATLSNALFVGAVADERLGHRDDALAGYAAALDQIEALRAGLDEEERSTFLGSTRYVYDRYIAYLLDLNKQFPAQDYGLEALEILERKSARAALEEIGQSAAEHFKGVPRTVVADEDAAGEAVDGAQRLLAALRSAAKSDAQAESNAERDLADARARAATVEAGIKAKYPAYYRLRNPQPLQALCRQSPCLSVLGFQQSVLKPGELMLVYDLLEDQSALWLIERDSFRVIALPGRKAIDSAVARLNAHVAGMIQLLEPGARAQRKLEESAASDVPGFATDSYALYRLLVPDAAAAAIARAKSLIVIPSGSLYRLAFETLVTKDPAGAAQPHYLIADVPISYMPSASLLAVVRSSYAQPTAGRNPLLAFANPAFGTIDPAAARGQATYADLQLAATRSVVASAGSKSTLSSAVFPPLPGTQTEADAVRTVLNASSDSLIVGDQVTRERILALNKAGRLRDYQYLLFATHAVLPSQVVGVTQPAIVLAHPERGDGLLTIDDVFGLSLDADFVALSACDTGIATADSSGEGISWFTHAFLYAGTPAISVTLWEVDDAAAPQITPAFFAGMHDGKHTPAQSLREAKLAMLKSPEARFRHPYAWAPSVIFGDGDRAAAP